MNRHALLIADDEEINREILAANFSDKFDIYQAENGLEAIHLLDTQPNIRAVLLDIFMPKMNGLEVLEEMKNRNLTKKIPVFVITASNDTDILSQAYNLGAVDIINKPFVIQFIRCRVENIAELYLCRDDLQCVISEQMQKLNAVNQNMIETLAATIEFRSCESGQHVRRLKDLTVKLLLELGREYPEYQLPQETILKIGNASVLHDVGKIAIPDNVLNKPGHLTPDEFDIVKQHTVRGAELLRQIPQILEADMFDYCYDICLHHHEKWDGKGYPEGLKGDNISIWSQVVSVADVFDALTSERCYKAALDRDTALTMIVNGECGVFNPKLLNAFLNVVKNG